MSPKITDQPIAKRSPTAIELFVMIMLVFMFFRFLAVAFLGFALAVHWCYPLHRDRRWLTLAYTIFLLSLLSPVDIDICHSWGDYNCDRKTGPRFVRLVMGLPNTVACRKKYGEFITGGCVTKGFEPKWILVW